MKLNGMNYRKYIKYYLVFAAVFFSVLTKADSTYSHLLSVEEFNSFLKEDTNIVIIDIRKLEVYNLGHYEGALNIWRHSYTNSSFDYGGVMPTRSQFKQTLSLLGILNSDKIILYDARGGCEAARFWWILKAYGHHNAFIIDGGYKALTLDNSKITDKATTTKTSQYEYPNKENLKLYASLEDVKKEMNDTNTIIIDTRTFDEYTGKILKKGAYQSGRIPNSIHYDWSNGIHFNTTQRLKSKDDLKYDFKKLGITKDKNIIVYCQSGVRSAHTTFVLYDILHYPNVKNYDGSWIEWSYNKGLPIEVGVENLVANSTFAKWILIGVLLLIISLAIRIVFGN